jgi:hexulose-6-phosphate isomerase
MNRRELMKSAGAAAMALAAGEAPALGREAALARGARQNPTEPLKLKFAVKHSMVRMRGSSELEKFKAVKAAGFDGIDMDHGRPIPLAEVLQARDESGLVIHGVVDPIHWNQRLSDPDAEVRAAGLAGLIDAIERAKAYGGSTVLLVPGRVTNAETESHEQVWERSIVEIGKALPLAADLGIRILIENVWNGFLYDPEGPDTQSPDPWIRYIDAIGSPWVDIYFDIGNQRRFAQPHDWIRKLGRRIVKLDVKDWAREGGFVKIGDGDVDWAAVRSALADIGYSGWATAEVSGGGPERLGEIRERMQKALVG